MCIYQSSVYKNIREISSEFAKTSITLKISRTGLQVWAAVISCRVTSKVMEFNFDFINSQQIRTCRKY